MQFILENPFAIVVSTAILLAIVFYFWTQTRFKWILYLLGGVFFAGVAMVIIERMIVTDREQIRDSMIVLAGHVANDDSDEVMKYFSQSDDTAAVRERAISFMKSTDIHACRVTRFKKYVWQGGDSAKKCELHLVAVGAGSIQGHTFDGPRELILQLEQESDGQWRIKNYTHRSALPQRRQR